jgi:hypothetical protein
MVAPVHNLDPTILPEGSAKLRWAGGGAQRPVGRGNESKKTGARSARARTRGQNPLVYFIFDCIIKHKTRILNPQQNNHTEW